MGRAMEGSAHPKICRFCQVCKCRIALPRGSNLYDSAINGLLSFICLNQLQMQVQDTWAEVQAENTEKALLGTGKDYDRSFP